MYQVIMENKKVINALKYGNAFQKRAYNALEETGIFEKLEEFCPFLAGTIPLDIYHDQSDLDIICYSDNLDRFERIVTDLFVDRDEFKSYRSIIRGEESLIVQFAVNEVEFEVFCQRVPIHEQYAVIHFKVEKLILDNSSNRVREGIRALKATGLKTEPAFAKFFQLEGDPYDALALLDENRVRELIRLHDTHD